MATGYTQFKTAPEMDRYLNSKVKTQVNGKEVAMWYTHREVASFVDRAKLQVWESFYCPEMDF